MQWLFSHPYISAIITAVTLIVIGMLIVSARSDVGTGATPPETWQTFGANLTDPLGGTPLPTPPRPQENLYTQVQGGPPFQYIALPTQTETPQNTEEPFNFEEFLSLLTRPKASTSIQTSGTGLEDTYSFIPGGLISTSTPTKARTELQSSMYEYGNDAGSYIQSYDEQYRNAPQILKDQFEDRQNEAKKVRLAELGDAMANVGASLQSIDPVPVPLRSANSALGTSYQTMGAKLKAVGAAMSDEQVLSAIMAYNSAVEAFTKNYVSLATLFSAHGVSFNMEEAGSVFMFTNSPGL